MLAVIGILLIFFAVVRHKWRDATAKKEEILRLVAIAAEEEVEVAKRERGDFIELPPPALGTQLQQRYCCAVCLAATTTRCSQCKAVRYCSGKCQIIHWRKGHKYECRPATLSRIRGESESVFQAGSYSKVERLGDGEAKHLATDYGVLDFKTFCDSAPEFSSSQESETSHFDSTNDFHDSDSLVRSDQRGFDASDSYFSQSASDSDVVDGLTRSLLNDVHNLRTLRVDGMKRIPPSNNDDILKRTSGKNKRTDGGRLDDHVLESPDLRISPSSGAMKTFTAQESEISIPHWNSEPHMSSKRETLCMLHKSSGNDQSNSREPDGLRSFVLGTDTKSSNKGLKTLRKFVENFKVSKQSSSYIFDIGKESADKDSFDISSQQIAVLPKIYPQLFSFNAVVLHPFGLKNCGNSCYANAVLQCLVFTRPIASYFLQGLHSNACHKKDWCLVCEFEQMTRKGQRTNSPLSPVRILSHVKRIGSHLSVGQQEDAHDFLRNFVEKMQRVWLEEAGISGSVAEDSTLLGLSFGGYLQSKIKCMKCSGRSEQFDRVMDLSVEIDGNIYSLEEALAQFTVSETLGGDDKYKCSRCKSYEKAKKKLLVAEAPNILTIVLKRFKSANSEKLSKFIRFPEDLDLTPYMSRSSDEYPLYSLYAVVVHLNTMNDSYSGHYVSYVKNLKGAWYKVDDCKVISVDLETVLSVEAYMLFYTRHAARIHSFSSLYSDYNTKLSTETTSARKIIKNKSSKSRPSLQYPPPADFFGNSRGDIDKWRDSPHKNPALDSSSDNSSIFSASDSGSYSTDSTKDSEISGYIFGSRVNQP